MHWQAKGLAAGLACLAFAGTLSAPGHAHDTALSDRVELGFGRSADYDYDPPAPGSYRLPRLKAAPDGHVVGADGHPLLLRQAMDGAITVLSFIYTRCADPRGCPLATGLLYDILYVSEHDPVIGENVKLISLSFDPEHDTPEVMAQYGAGARSGEGDHAEWLFLTTRSAAELEPILAAYGQPVGVKDDVDDPFGPFAHQLRLFLIDRRGWIRNIYSLGFLDPRLVITDVRTLLLEESGHERER